MSAMMSSLTAAAATTVRGGCRAARASTTRAAVSSRTTTTTTTTTNSLAAAAASRRRRRQQKQQQQSSRFSVAVSAASSPENSATKTATTATAKATTTPSSAAKLPSLRPDESPDSTLDRRLRESARVEERVTHVDTIEEVRAELEKAGDRLVVLEVQSNSVCDSGICEEAEAVWKEEARALEAQAKQRCLDVKHAFARTARDCPDVEFLSLDADGDDGERACRELGVSVLPSVQFYKSGKLLWQHGGHDALERDLGEGVLFYGDSAGGGVKASSYVTDVSSRAQLDEFLSEVPAGELTVLDVSSSSAAPCVHVFPAVLALARNFKGYASFARLLADASADASALSQELGVLEVPTFVFFRGGEEVGRHVGSSRGDLIGQILQQQARDGAALPPPPPRR